MGAVAGAAMVALSVVSCLALIGVMTVFMIVFAAMNEKSLGGDK